MFISLLYAHMRFHCVENLYYCTHECYHCSITGYPPVEPHAAIKGGWEALPEAPTIWSHGLPLVFLLLPSWNLCSVLQQKMLEENLRVTKEVSATSSCNPASLSGSMLEIISLHIPMRQVLGGWVASSCVILLWFLGCGYPRTDISGRET